MAITLTKSAETLTLPEALDWSDEFTWSPVEQVRTYTTTGALLIEEATRQAGRPITLQGSEDSTWCTRQIVDTLRTWAASPGAVMTLVLRGVSRQVTFNHDGGALQGLPVIFYADGSIDSADYYVPTIKFLEL